MEKAEKVIVDPFALRAGKPMFDRSATTNLKTLFWGGVYFAAGFIYPPLIVFPILRTFTETNKSLRDRLIESLFYSAIVAATLATGTFAIAAMWYGALRMTQAVFQYPMLRLTSLKWNIFNGFKLKKSWFNVLFTLAGIAAGAGLGLLMLPQIPMLMTAMALVHASIGSVTMLAIMGTAGLMFARLMNLPPHWGIFFGMAVATFLPIPAAFTLAIDFAVLSACGMGFANTFVAKYIAQLVTWWNHGDTNADGKFVPLEPGLTDFDSKIGNAPYDQDTKHKTVSFLDIKDLRIALLELLNHKASAKTEFDNTPKLVSNSVKNILFQLDQVYKAEVEVFDHLYKKNTIEDQGSVQGQEALKLLESAKAKVTDAKATLAKLLVTSDSKSDIHAAVTKQKGDDFQVKTFTIPSNNYPNTTGCNEVQLQAHTLFMKSLLNVPAAKAAPPKTHEYTLNDPKSTAAQYYESTDKIVSALTK